MRHGKAPTLYMTISLSVLAGILLAGCGIAKSDADHVGTSAHVRSLLSSRSTITINSQIGETFAPAPTSARPALTASQAWAKFARLNGFKHLSIPRGVTVSLGLFTLASGPPAANGSRSYIAKGELAYGYRSHSCPIYENPSVTKPPASPCILWNFLNADTGLQIVMGWQQ